MSVQTPKRVIDTRNYLIDRFDDIYSSVPRGTEFAEIVDFLISNDYLSTEAYKREEE